MRCGIDIVAVERVARLHRELGDEKMARLFGAQELERCRARRFGERHLAVRFAAKEACLKLFPDETASGKLGVEDIDVREGENGSLRIELGGRLREAMARTGVARIALSTSACTSEACAIAVVAATVDGGIAGADAAENAAGEGDDSLARAVRMVRELKPSLLGRAIYRFFPVRRRVILRNQRRVFGDALAPSEHRMLAQAFYDHMVRFLIEIAGFALKPMASIASAVDVENMESPLQASRSGRGIILLTGHFGNWEISCAAGILRFPEYRGKFHFLRRPISNRLVEGLVLRRFRRAGLGVIPKKGSIERILDLLERNEVLVFIHDQHASVPKDGIPVEFFGTPAGTFRSLAIIARASGATVIPARAWRCPGGRHTLRFEEPLEWISHSDPTEEIRLNTRAYNRAIERMVLAQPEQWFWMHKRWKL